MTDDYFTCKRTNRNRLTENEHMFTGGRVTGERQTRIEDRHVHSAIFKVDNQQGSIV